MKKIIEETMKASIGKGNLFDGLDEEKIEEYYNTAQGVENVKHAIDLAYKLIDIQWLQQNEGNDWGLNTDDIQELILKKYDLSELEMQFVCVIVWS